MAYKWCAVSGCTNTSLKTPDKLFKSLPKDVEIRRNSWMQLARKNPSDISKKTYFCEDHFDMEKDITNFYKYKMGFSQKPVAAKGAMPSKFYCQPDGRKSMTDESSTSCPTYRKRLKTEKHQEIIGTFEGQEDSQPIKSAPEVLLIETPLTTEIAIKVEDDIDIEEHDILDHPRVRSLFPDLGIVKNETTDLETQDDIATSALIPNDVPNTAVEHQTIYISDLSDFHVTAYEECITEEPSDTDMSSDKIVHFPLTASECNLPDKNENIPLDRTAHIPPDILNKSSANNVISIGNKLYDPINCFQPTETVEFNKSREALTPDHKPRSSEEMRNSPETSSLLNQSEEKKSFSDSEQASDAEQDGDKIPKRLTSKYFSCSICSFYVRNFSNIVIHMSSCHGVDTGGFNIESFNPKCRLCSNTFKSISSLRSHIKGVHRENFLKKVNEAHILFVPKSVIYQCKVCSIHFTSFTNGYLHRQKCVINKDKWKTWKTWKCDTCKIFFESKDQTKHSLQHSLNPEQFKVYFLENDTLDRLLNKCAECETYLDEITFAEHCKAPCKREFEKCALCELDIHSSSVKKHYLMHKTLSKKSKFITIEFAKFKKHFIPKDSAAYKSWKVYICAKCGSSIIGSRLKVHISAKCLGFKKKSPCMTCGLTCSYHQLTRFHMRYPKHTIMDMQFFDVDTEELIIPPFPSFPRCVYCDVHLIREKSDHLCKDPFRTCEQCKENFSDLAYKIHKQYHQYATMNSWASKNIETALLPIISTVPSNSSTDNVQTPCLKSCSKKEEKNLLVLFLCSTCDIVQDSYDKTVEHCQKHLNNIETDGIIIKDCEICHLKFDSTCFEQHMRLHALNIHSFKVVKYNYNSLVNYWVESFKGQVKEIDQIVENSIYFYTRKVKLRLVQDGEPESTQYKCCKCEKYVAPKMVYAHTLTKCDINTPGLACLICKSECFSELDMSEHMSLHEKFNNFRIVYFNELGDEDFNKKLARKYIQRSKFIKRERKKPNKILYYKCELCSILLPFDHVSKHLCSKSLKLRCLECNLLFAPEVYDTHMQLHEFNPNYNRQHLRVTYFHPNSYQQ